MLSIYKDPASGVAGGGAKHYVLQAPDHTMQAAPPNASILLPQNGTTLKGLLAQCVQAPAKQ